MPWDKWRTVKRSDHFIRFTETFLTVSEGSLIGKPVKLHPFQKDIARDILDALPSTGRPPTQAVVSMPRGQGKTSLGSYLAVWHAFTTPGARAIVVATKEAQALILLDQAIAMIEDSELLSSACVTSTHSRSMKATVTTTRAEILATGSRVAGLQGLRPSLVLLDEVGFVGDDVWSALSLGLGKHKDSQLIAFGTPGFDRGQMWRLRSVAQSADPPPGLVYHEIAAKPGYEDDPFSRDTIRAANPAVKAGFLDLESIRSNARTETRADFLTFRLGVWAQREEAWIDSEDWGALSIVKTLPPDGAVVSLGFDGSVGGPGRDTTALTLAYSDQVHVLGYWAPPPGSAKGWRVDREDVIRTIDRAMVRWRATLYADPWHWRTELEDLTKRYGARVIEQNTGSRARFGPMVDRFATSVREGTLTHDGSEDLRSHVLGAVAEPSAEGTLIRKDLRLVHRPFIDLAVSACLAHNGQSLTQPAPRIF